MVDKAVAALKAVADALMEPVRKLVAVVEDLIK